MTQEDAYKIYIPQAVDKLCTTNQLAALNMSAADVAGEVYISMCEKNAFDKLSHNSSKSGITKFIATWTKRVVATLFRKTNFGKKNELTRNKKRNATPERKSYLKDYRSRWEKEAKRDRTAYMREYMKFYRKKKKMRRGYEIQQPVNKWVSAESETITNV